MVNGTSTPVRRVTWPHLWYSHFIPPQFFSPDIIVANGSTLAVTDVGQHNIPTSSQNLSLRNILVSPHLIKTLISVKILTHDNPVNVEFDDRGFLSRIEEEGKDPPL